MYIHDDLMNSIDYLNPTEGVPFSVSRELEEAVIRKQDCSVFIGLRRLWFMMSALEGPVYKLRHASHD